MHKKRHNVKWIILGSAIIFAIMMNQCSKSPVEQQDTILIKVGDRTITVEEFKMRTEFTIRQRYPTLNDIEIKNLCINNLIAEKLFALEGQHDEKLTKNPIFQAQMRGIKEQKMREQLYFKEAVTPVVIDTAEIKHVFPLAGIEYDVSFYTIQNDTLATRIKSELDKNPDQFEQLFHRYSTQSVLPKKTVTFKDPDPAIVNDSLYSQTLNIGQVIGPLKLNTNEYIVMRVDNWKNYPAISTTDVQNRFHDVQKKLKEKKSEQIWHDFKVDLMQGKRVEFNKETFIQLSNIFFEIYGTKDQLIKQKVYNEFIGGDAQTIQFDNNMFEDVVLDHPFLTIDGEEWTVRDFRNEYMLHPLVVQYRATSLNEFQPEFHKAIISMITDHFLTQDAYKKNLDEHPEVKRTYTMWTDAFLAQYQRDQYLTKIRKQDDFNPDLMKGKHNYVSIYTDSLQKKYKDKIIINEPELNKIQLTNVDMLVTIPGAPYPIAVPGFPEYTQENHVNYARHNTAN